MYLQFAYGDIRWSYVSLFFFFFVTCRKVILDAEGHFLLHLVFSIKLTCFVLMLADCLINCSSSGNPDSVQNSLPVVISGGDMLLPLVGW